MIDLSRSTNPEIGVAAHVIQALTRTTGIPVMVVGATARNMLGADLGLRPSRATSDVDVAVMVNGWAEFREFTAHLEPVGARGHTFAVLGVEVDVVPCGGVEAADRTLLWPDDHVMNLLGMREAYDSRTQALLPGDVAVDVPTIAGLAVLKLIAWTDRGRVTSRDASDLAEILDWCSCGRLLERLYLDAADVVARYDFDVELAGSYVLGADMADIMGDETPGLAAVLDGDALPRLASSMPRTVLNRPAMLRALVDALREHS